MCLNGLVVGEVFEQIKFRHIVGENFEQCYDRIFTLLPIFLKNIEEMVRVVESTTSVKLTEIDIRRIIFNLKLPKTVKTAVYDILISRKYNRYEDSHNTIWTLFNVINECIDKNCRSERAKVEHNKKLLADIVALAA